MSDRWYQELLRCPSCSAPLQRDEQAFRCTKCSAQYPSPTHPTLVPTELREHLYGRTEDRSWKRWHEAMQAFEQRRGERSSSIDSNLRGLLDKAALGKTVLEVGAYDGALRKQFPEGTRYVGLDPRPAASAELDERSVLVKGVAEALPFREGAFEGAVCVFSLEYFVDGAKALAELARVLQTSSPFALVVRVESNTVALARAAPSRTERLLGALRVASQYGSRAGLEVAQEALRSSQRAQTHYYTRAQVVSLVSVRFEVLDVHEVSSTASSTLYVHARKRKIVRKLKVL